MIILYKEYSVKVLEHRIPRVGYRWKGTILLGLPSTDTKVLISIPGSIGSWLAPNETLIFKPLEEPITIGRKLLFFHYQSYELCRLYNNQRIKIWPVWKREYELRKRQWSGKTIYKYIITAREAITSNDYREIVSLEQYHYASKKEKVAIWRCPVCGKYIESNIQPECPDHKIPMLLHEIKGSLPSSRFLLLELTNRKPYEPRIIGYVRIDTPLPLMSRKIETNGKVIIERMIREKIFEKEWFHPTFWPLNTEEKKMLMTRYRELLELYKSRSLARTILSEEHHAERLAIVNTAASRIARVVIHPEYRGDGLGVLAVKAAIEWIKEARIPEMKKEKKIIETVAQMARYNPFFEKAGFYYLWETAGDRPALFYPLTKDAEEKIQKFLREDPYAKIHKGKLYTPSYPEVPRIGSPIVYNNVTKSFRSILDISGLPEELQVVLKAFGVERREIEKTVLEKVNLSIKPGEIVAIIGTSGAGKTTFLRMLIGKIQGKKHPLYIPDEGEIIIPNNIRVAILLPGEIEPEYGNETLLEHIYRKIGNENAAIEVLNSVGLADAVFYRAKFKELSTGQKERAKLASLFAETPNLIIIDEFASHLDPLTAMRVARKIGQLARAHGITLLVSTHRKEVLEAIEPNEYILIGYGKAIKTKEIEI